MEGGSSECSCICGGCPFFCFLATSWREGQLRGKQFVKVLGAEIIACAGCAVQPVAGPAIDIEA